ncbi:hypothetical protein HKCCE2091_14285 [Rhodobacterales bacterium HKCCE2091]|nr:hypothetical protein [Rhodobacterales bacterium HKCCE2091]
MTRWLGVWDLVPELCHYDIGQPPVSGRYAIDRDGAQIRFTIDWTDADGQSFHTGFAAPADGTMVESDAPGVESFSVTAESDRVLSSEARMAGNRSQIATRRVSADGTTMSVLMRLPTPDGGENSVFQVYRRADDA